MDHYDGPAFRRDAERKTPEKETTGYELPPQQHSVKKTKAPAKAATPKKEPVYHSVDPLAQFVTPPSTVNRKPRPKIDYAPIIASFTRSDEDVVLISHDEAGAVVDLTEQPAAQSAPADSQPSVQDTHLKKAQPVATENEVGADSAESASNISTESAAQSWPVELVRPAPPAPQDGSPIQHPMAVSALVPRVAPAPTWLAINIAINNYFNSHPEQLMNH